MSMDLLYKNRNNDIHDVINMSNSNQAMYSDQITNSLLRNAKNLTAAFTKEASRYDEEQDIQCVEAFPDHEYLRHLQEQKNLLFEMMGDANIMLDLYHTFLAGGTLPAADFMRMVCVVLMDPQMSSHDLRYSAAILAELTTVLQYQGNVEVYWA